MSRNTNNWSTWPPTSYSIIDLLNSPNTIQTTIPTYIDVTPRDTPTIVFREEPMNAEPLFPTIMSRDTISNTISIEDTIADSSPLSLSTLMMLIMSNNLVSTWDNTTTDNMLDIIIPDILEHTKNDTVPQERFDQYTRKNHDSTCGICLESNKEGKVVELPCMHYFHETCIAKWLLEKANTCPMCKQECK